MRFYTKLRKYGRTHNIGASVSAIQFSKINLQGRPKSYIAIVRLSRHKKWPRGLLSLPVGHLIPAAPPASQTRCCPSGRANTIRNNFRVKLLEKFFLFSLRFCNEIVIGRYYCHLARRFFLANPGSSLTSLAASPCSLLVRLLAGGHAGLPPPQTRPKKFVSTPLGPFPAGPARGKVPTRGQGRPLPLGGQLALGHLGQPRPASLPRIQAPSPGQILERLAPAPRVQAGQTPGSIIGAQHRIGRRTEGQGGAQGRHGQIMLLEGPIGGAQMGPGLVTARGQAHRFFIMN